MRFFFFRDVKNESGKVVLKYFVMEVIVVVKRMVLDFLGGFNGVFVSEV